MILGGRKGSGRIRCMAVITLRVTYNNVQHWNEKMAYMGSVNRLHSKFPRHEGNRHFLGCIPQFYVYKLVSQGTN
jgi:hypothetical protein